MRIRHAIISLLLIAGLTPAVLLQARTATAATDPTLLGANATGMDVATNPTGGRYAVLVSQGSSQFVDVSSDAGVSWQQISGPAGVTLSKVTIDDAGTLSGLTVTSNGNSSFTTYDGSSWSTPIAVGVYSYPGWFVTSGTVLIAEFLNQPWQSPALAASTDGGHTWSSYGNPPGFYSGRAAVIGGYVQFAGVSSNGTPIYFRYNIAAHTVESIPVPMPAGAWNMSLGHAPGSTTHLYLYSTVATGSPNTGAPLYILESTDAGTTWSMPVRADLPPAYLRGTAPDTESMVIGADGKLHVIASLVNGSSMEIDEAGRGLRANDGWGSVNVIGTVPGTDGGNSRVVGLQPGNGDPSGPLVLFGYIWGQPSGTKSVYELQGPGTAIAEAPMTTFSTTGSLVLQNCTCTQFAASPSRSWEAALSTASPASILRSADGAHWQRVPLPPNAVTSGVLGVADDGELYYEAAANPQGYYSATNFYRYVNGRWYGAVTFGGTSSQFTGPARLIKLAGPNILAVERDSGYVYLSKDDGGTWAYRGYLFVGYISQFAVQGNYLYDLSVSSQGIESFTRLDFVTPATATVSTPPALANSFATLNLMPRPGSANEVWITGFDGTALTTFQSTDNGNNWSTHDSGSVPSGMPASGAAVGFGADNRLYMYGASYNPTIAKASNRSLTSPTWSTPTTLDSYTSNASGTTATIAYDSSNVAITPPDVWVSVSDGSLHHYGQLGGLPPDAQVIPSESFGGQNLSEPCAGCAAGINTTGDPIDASTGNLWRTIDDLSLPGRGPAIDFTQTYNSLAASTAGPLGYGWTFSYNMSLVANADASAVTINQENGSTVAFTLADNAYRAAARVIATLKHNGDGSWTFTRTGRQSYTFNSAGQLTAITDLNGYRTSLTYAGGQLATITDPAGRRVTLTWSGSLISTIADSTSLARTVRFGYDASSNLTSITDAGGAVTTAGYDSAHRLTQFLDPNQQGASTKHYLTTVYDPTSSRVTSQTDFLGRVTTFDYTSIPGATKITDPKGNITVNAYLNGMPTAVTKGYGTAQAASWLISYDPATLMPNATLDPLGNTTSRVYDSRGRLTSVTDPLGNTASYTYNAFDELATKTDRRQVTTTYSYDAAGNLTSVSTPVDTQPGTSQTTTYTLGDASHPGDVTSMTDPDGKVWRYSYDSYGDLGSVSDPITPTADVETFCYDDAGRRLRDIQPRGTAAGVSCSTPNPSYTTAYTYDAYGNVLSTVDALGHQSVRTYDADQNLKTVRDGNQQTTTYTYDLDNERTQVGRPDGSTLLTDYWPDGSLKGQTDGAAQTTSYAFDPLGHLTSVTDPLNRVTQYSYDALGHQLWKQDPGGNCTTTPATGCTSRTYDADGQLKSISYSDGVTSNVTAISYDADGERTAMTDGTGTSTWAWDSVNRLTRSTNGANLVTSYGYDLRGHVTSIGYPGGRGTVQRSYDDAGRLQSVTDWNNKTTTFSYNADNFLTGSTLPNSTAITNTPDAADNVTGIVDSKGASTLASFSYTRDNDDEVLTTASTGVPADTHTYSYTQLNQLRSVDNAPLAYDAADNPTTLTSGYTQSYDAANQLTGTGHITLVGTASAGAATTPNTLTINLPAGTAAGDQIVVAATLGYGKTVSTPTGYTATPGSPFVSGTSNTSAQLAVFRRTAVAGDTSVSLAFSTKTAKSVVIAVYRGVDPASPIDAAPVTASAAPGSSIVLPSITTSIGGDQLVALQGAIGAATAGTWTTPVLTERVQQSGGTTAVAALADQAALPRGATGTRTATFSTSTQLVGALIALRPQLTTFTFDTRGNRLTANGQTLVYDQANRLTRYGSTATYGYDGDGLRASKTVAGTTTQQAWDVADGLPLLITDGATSYIYGPNNQPIEQVSASGTLYYYADQLGSTRALADSTGIVVASYTYDAAGRLAGSTGTVTNPFQYAGEYTDAESGLGYLRDRYYDPTTAQFLTRDPVVTATRSAYAYAANNPLNVTDPTGDDPGAPTEAENTALAAINLATAFCAERETGACKYLKKASSALRLANTSVAAINATGSCLAGQQTECQLGVAKTFVTMIPPELTDFAYPQADIGDLTISTLETVIPKLEAQKQEEIDQINILIACNPAQLGDMKVITLDGSG
ncbi:MAG TPA: RHS repeat-associated core domain-containing protein [Jatrophihabitans sp.]|nr:RHS repeat-associated core domain-containing protein [Jatrophihabitans sp.]